MTKNGESYVALIDVAHRDDYRQLERERIHLLILEDARRGMEGIAAGRTENPDTDPACWQKGTR